MNLNTESVYIKPSTNHGVSKNGCSERHISVNGVFVFTGAELLQS